MYVTMDPQFITMWWNTCLQSTKQSDIADFVLNILQYLIQIYHLKCNKTDHLKFCIPILQQHDVLRKCPMHIKSAPIYKRSANAKVTEYSPFGTPQCPQQRQVVLQRWFEREKNISCSQFNSLCKNPTRTRLLLGSLAALLGGQPLIQWDRPDITLDCIESEIRKWLVLVHNSVW